VSKFYIFAGYLYHTITQRTYYNIRRYYNIHTPNPIRFQKWYVLTYYDGNPWTEYCAFDVVGYVRGVVDKFYYDEYLYLFDFCAFIFRESAAVSEVVIEKYYY